MTMQCKVCREPERRRLVDADYAGGLSAAAIARRLEAGGWPVGSATIIKHLKEHFIPGSPTGVARNKRDAAILLQEKIMDEVERRERVSREIEESEGELPDFRRFDILDKDLQPALGTVLRAQGLIDKREQAGKTQKVGLFMLMLGGAEGRLMLAPPDLSGSEDGIVIEGEFESAD